MVPIRFACRNRWWTLAWAIGILVTAVNIVGGLDASRHSAKDGSGVPAQASDDPIANVADVLQAIR